MLVKREGDEVLVDRSTEDPEQRVYSVDTEVVSGTLGPQELGERTKVSFPLHRGSVVCLENGCRRGRW